MKKNIILVSIAALSLFSCESMLNNTNTTKSMDEKVKRMSNCEKTKALIQSHKNGFKIIRDRKTSTKFSDIWTVKYHLIGQGCQIFRWKNNKFSYMCSIMSPGKQVAMERYNSAKSKIESCLGDSWELEERARSNKEGSIAVYTHKGHRTSVSTHAFETNGIFDEEWTNYVYIGDQERIK